MLLIILIDKSNINIPPAVTKLAVEKWGYTVAFIENPSQELIKLALNCERFMKQDDGKIYHDYVVHNAFPTNSIMANKWLRYAENIRGM